MFLRSLFSKRIGYSETVYKKPGNNRERQKRRMWKFLDSGECGQLKSG